MASGIESPFPPFKAWQLFEKVGMNQTIGCVVIKNVICFESKAIDCKLRMCNEVIKKDREQEPNEATGSKTGLYSRILNGEWYSKQVDTKRGFMYESR